MRSSLRSGWMVSAAAATLFCLPSARADTFTYTEHTTVNGSLNGIAFASQPVTLMGMGDPANTVLSGRHGLDETELLQSLTISVGGTSALVTVPATVVYSYEGNTILFGTPAGYPYTVFFVENILSGGEDYTPGHFLGLNLSLTGFSGAYTIDFPTTLGDLVLSTTGLTNYNVAYTQADTSAVTPEPTSFLLLVTGMACLAVALRRGMLRESQAGLPTA